MRASTRNAVIFVALCAAILIVLVFHPRPAPPETAIADQINYAVAGANNRSAGQVMEIISNDYGDDNTMTATSMRILLARGFGNANKPVTVMTTPTISVTGNTATSDSKLTVTGSNGEVYFDRPVHLEWREEQGHAWLVFPMPVWRVVKAEYGQALDFGD